jgi:hypothetical protein
MTTTTFSDYAAEAEERQDVASAVLTHTFALCEALRQNFIKYSIDQHERSIEYADAGDVSSVRYHEGCIEKLKKGTCDYEFYPETGRKYHKIIMTASGSPSVHAFVDKKIGSVLKPASWKGPAKGTRYDLRIIEQREWLLENADWAGSYLYAK